MSSRILPGDERRIESFNWRSYVPNRTGGAEPSGLVEEMDLNARLSVLAAEAERRVEDAYRRGRVEGLNEGERAAKARLEPVMTRLTQTIAEVSTAATRLRREAEGDVVKLAVAIAGRILNRELSLDPDALLGLVKAAFAKIDAREVHQLRANPEDAPRIEKELAGTALVKPIPVIADAALDRGSVVLETTRGVLDASVNSQLDEIERGLTDRLRRGT